MPTTTKTIRVFILSTFSDLKAERMRFRGRCRRNGRDAQEVKGGGAAELFQFALGNSLNVLRPVCFLLQTLCKNTLTIPAFKCTV